MLFKPGIGGRLPSPERLVDIWTIASSTGTALAAVFAGVQIWLSKRDANRRATLEALLLIDSRLQPIWADDTAAMQRDIVRCYSEKKGVPEECRRYLAFLNALDLVALSIENGLVDRELTTKHLNPLLQTHLVSLSFLTDFQRCCGDSAIYENLMRYFRQQLATRRLPRPEDNNDEQRT